MGEVTAGFDEVVLYNSDGDAIAVVKRNSTSTQLPAGISPGLLLVGGVQAGSPDTYRGLDMDSSGRPPARLYDASGNALSSVAPGAAGVRQLDVAVRSGLALDSAEAVIISNIIQTTTTTANQVVATYTVPVGKTLYLQHISICMGAGASITGICTINVAGAAWARMFLSDFDSGKTPGVLDWQRTFPQGIPIATAGQAINITVTPGGTSATYWTGMIIGFVR